MNDRKNAYLRIIETKTGKITIWRGIFDSKFIHLATRPFNMTTLTLISQPGIR